MHLMCFLPATKESVWMVLYFDAVDGVDGSDFLLDSSVLLVFMVASLFDRFKGSDVFHPGLPDLTGLNA